jgi:hypothetical protein
MHSRYEEKIYMLAFGLVIAAREVIFVFGS